MMKPTLVALFAFLAVAFARTQWHELDNYSFEKFVQEFNKQYVPHEVNLRRSLFESRLREIRQHNANPVFTWKQGVNHLTDRTTQEFERRLGSKKGLLYSSKKAVKASELPFTVKPLSALPQNVDWRDKGVVTAVKDQGDCGSCWAFGTTETIESHWAITTGLLGDLSEQQILDCVPNDDDCGGTGGCNGGTPELAIAKLIKMGGQASEWTYPYISYFGANETCKFGGNTPAMANVTGFTVLPSNEFDAVFTAIAEVGPLAVNVDASSWSSYESGVYNGCNQTNPDIDHVVQLVGYGTDPQLGDYWLVRNSWSPAWGESGYIRLARNSSPQCGVDLNPQDGTGCNNGPPTVTVCGTCAILYDVSYPTIGGN
eukprot:TRINITY_DN127_c0_g1_i2.p1 TRINITY_DN127_c0_g1~~TRINITY_DN127_c0_g1_i2.p1  ORF type:complete len:371 (-),score=153.17 TRINITY_DN127_c0_g1_i2:252-1364(-)